MMNLLLRLPVYACVATCVAEAIFFGYLATKGNVGKNELDEIAAVVYGIDRYSVDGMVAEYRIPEFVEPVDLEALNQNMLSQRLDLDLREGVIDKALVDLTYYEENLLKERARYNELRLAFEDKMTRLGETSTSRTVVEVRRALEVLTPAQAKDQILRLFESNQQRSDDEIANDAVAIIRTMPIDKQKRIIAEFKTEEDKRRLAGILRLIRLGVPEVPLIREARSQLEKFDPRTENNSQSTVP